MDTHLFIRITKDVCKGYLFVNLRNKERRQRKVKIYDLFSLVRAVIYVFCVMPTRKTVIYEQILQVKIYEFFYFYYNQEYIK